MAALPLKEIWQKLCAPYTTDQDLLERLWLEIEKAYAATGRHYHNLQHLASLLSLAVQHTPSIADPDALKFAIFYHDIIYRALSKTNEEDSAVLAKERLQQLGLPHQQQDKIRQMILATKSHTLSPDPDTNLLLDFDLSILAASWEDYLTYTRQIRKEYSLVPYFLYRKGRKKVLTHFLSLPCIYKTPLFIKQHEALARENLQKELEMLSS